MNELQIVHDYKTLAIPIDMIARKNGVSLHRVIDVVYRATVVIPESIELSKKILKELL